MILQGFFLLQEHLYMHNCNYVASSELLYNSFTVYCIFHFKYSFIMFKVILHFIILFLNKIKKNYIYALYVFL